MTAPDCLLPGSCPVPDPDDVDLRRLRSQVWPAGTQLRRGHRRAHRAEAAVPAVAQLPDLSRRSRFAPVLGAGHSYVARREAAALLESLLHDVTPTSRQVPWHLAAGWVLSHVELVRDVRLIDLRDDALPALGLARDQLVASSAAHHPCTGVWAHRLHARHVGGHATDGLVWNSRQAEVHATAAGNPVLEDLLTGEQTEVAVLWGTPDRQWPLRAVPGASWELGHGRGGRLLLGVANLLGAHPAL